MFSLINTLPNISTHSSEIANNAQIDVANVLLSMSTISSAQTDRADEFRNETCGSIENKKSSPCITITELEEQQLTHLPHQHFNNPNDKQILSSSQHTLTSLPTTFLSSRSINDFKNSTTHQISPQSISYTFINTPQQTKPSIPIINQFKTNSSSISKKTEQTEVVQPILSIKELNKILNNAKEDISDDRVSSRTEIGGLRDRNESMRSASFTSDYHSLSPTSSYTGDIISDGNSESPISSCSSSKIEFFNNSFEVDDSPDLRELSWLTNMRISVSPEKLQKKPNSILTLHSSGRESGTRFSSTRSFTKKQRKNSNSKSNSPHMALPSKGRLADDIIYSMSGQYGTRSKSTIGNKCLENIPPDYRSHKVQLSQSQRSTEKPPFSYALLVYMALISKPDQAMTLSEIYKWIMNNFPYYKNVEHIWQNSVRHNLSVNKCFEKVKSNKGFRGKGYLWRISEKYRTTYPDFVQKAKLNWFPNGAPDDHYKYPPHLFDYYQNGKMTMDHLNRDQSESEFELSPEILEEICRAINDTADPRNDVIRHLHSYSSSSPTPADDTDSGLGSTADPFDDIEETIAEVAKFGSSLSVSLPEENIDEDQKVTSPEHKNNLKPVAVNVRDSIQVLESNPLNHSLVKPSSVSNNEGEFTALLNADWSQAENTSVKSGVINDNNTARSTAKSSNTVWWYSDKKEIAELLTKTNQDPPRVVTEITIAPSGQQVAAVNTKAHLWAQSKPIRRRSTRTRKPKRLTDYQDEDHRNNRKKRKSSEEIIPETPKKRVRRKPSRSNRTKSDMDKDVVDINHNISDLKLKENISQSDSKISSEIDLNNSLNYSKIEENLTKTTNELFQSLLEESAQAFSKVDDTGISNICDDNKNNNDDDLLLFQDTDILMASLDTGLLNLAQA